MVLSRIVLNLDARSARRDLADAYEMHSTLMRLADGGASRPLWRLERTQPPQAPQVLVQTDIVPDWDKLLEVDESYFIDVDSRPNRLLENIASGDSLRFRVRANPTVTREGKRHGLVQFDEQVEWIERQLLKHSARPLGVIPSESRREVFKRRRGGRPITIVGVTFDGAFKVDDATGVRRLVRDGLGHARSLGFGLVTLAR